MSDKLDWRNKHAVLLREPQWAGIAARENYKIRADLRPMFEAHPASEDLLGVFAETRQFREGCEFIARMTHRRAAVWWGYCCLLSLQEEKRDVASGRFPARPLVEGFDLVKEMPPLPKGFELPPLDADADDLENFCKVPKVDYREMLKSPVAPPQDRSALDAASAAVKAKVDGIDALLPEPVKQAFSAARVRVDGAYLSAVGMTPKTMFEQAVASAEAGPLTYSVQRADSPRLKPILDLPGKFEKMRKGILGSLASIFPEKFPKTPEAAKLLKAERDKISDDAVQAVWRWIVAPDDRNTTLALAAGNAAAQHPEGLLAYAAAWSYGDLTPEGKQVIPVPPELPGTGLVSALLMMALDAKGHRSVAARYEHYFNLGLEVVYGKNLWPSAVMEDLSPHQHLTAESPAPVSAPAAGDNAPAYRKWTK